MLPQILPPIPPEVFVIPIMVTFEMQDVDPDTGAPVPAFVYTGMCGFSEKPTKQLSAERKNQRLLGRVVLAGDPAPHLPIIDSGTVVIFPGQPLERKMLIAQTFRPRNPNGTVHHTSIDLT